MTLDEQIKILNEYKDGKQIYRKRRFSSNIESEKFHYIMKMTLMILIFMLMLMH